LLYEIHLLDDGSSGRQRGPRDMKKASLHKSRPPPLTIALDAALKRNRAGNPSQIRFTHIICADFVSLQSGIHWYPQAALRQRTAQRMAARRCQLTQSLT